MRASNTKLSHKKIISGKIFKVLAFIRVHNSMYRRGGIICKLQKIHELEKT